MNLEQPDNFITIKIHYANDFLRRTISKYRENPGIRVKIQQGADLYALQKELENFRQEFLRRVRDGEVNVDITVFENTLNLLDECIAPIRWKMYLMQLDVNSSTATVQIVTEEFV